MNKRALTAKFTIQKLLVEDDGLTFHKTPNVTNLLASFRSEKFHRLFYHNVLSKLMGYHLTWSTPTSTNLQDTFIIDFVSRWVMGYLMQSRKRASTGRYSRCPSGLSHLAPYRHCHIFTTTGLIVSRWVVGYHLRKEQKGIWVKVPGISHLVTYWCSIHTGEKSPLHL